MKLYNKDKWLDIINNEEYQLIRDKIKNEFKELTFEESEHRYFVGDRELTCVSNVTHMFQEHFDSEGIAQKTYEKHYNNENSKYYHMMPKQILESWQKISKNACDLGTERHNFGESCFYFMTGDYDNIVPDFKNRLHTDEIGDLYFESIYPKEDAIVKFWSNIPKFIVPILAENKVFAITDDYAYSGTFDILFYYDAKIDGKQSNLNGLIIGDYKTNADLYKNFNGKKLLHPFEELFDMSLNVYKLQLSAYQHCLENIGLNVIARRLVWLKPNGEYEKIPLEQYVKKLTEGLIEHKEELK